MASNNLLKQEFDEKEDSYAAQPAVIIMDEYGDLHIPTDDHGRVVKIGMTEWETAGLFGVMTPTIRAAMKAVYKSGFVREYETKRYVRKENGNGIEVYGFEMIVALAFRVDSVEAEKLRKCIFRTLGTASERPGNCFRRLHPRNGEAQE